MEIPQWIAKLPEPLRNDNLLAALLGAIVSALIIERAQITKGREKEINQINTIKVIVLAALENTMEMKRQFATGLVADLHQFRNANQLAMERPGGLVQTMGSRYLFQFPVPTFEIAKAVSIATNMNLKSGRLLRGILRLQEGVHVLRSTAKQRNEMVGEFKSMIEKCNTKVEKDSLRLRMYGLPNGDGILDITLATQTEALYLYCDDVLKFAEVTLNNIDKYAQRFLTILQRRKLFRFSIEGMEGMPPSDHLAPVVDALVILKPNTMLGTLKKAISYFCRTLPGGNEAHSR